MSAVSSSDSNRRQALATSVERCFLIAMSNPQCDHYLLVLASSSARRIFAEQSKRSVRLPRISIPRWTRAAEQVQAVLEAKWGLKAVVIDFLGDSPGRDSIIIAELRDEHAVSSLPLAHSWVRLSDIPEGEISGSERLTVERLLDDGSTGRGTFSRFRWIEEALNWVSTDAALGRAQFTGDVRQFNAGAACTLVRFGRKDAPPIWIKAAGDDSSREFRITTMLARLIPKYLPTIIASREDWNAWWMEDAGQSLDDVRSPEILRQVVLSLAEIQKASIRYGSMLLAGGCSDQRISTLRARIPQLMEYISEATASQTSNHAPRLGADRIQEIGSSLEDACFRLEALGIPDTLIHSDLSFGNILAGPRRCVFTDWAYACVGNPFLNYEHLRVQIAQETCTGQCVPRLTEVYLESWRQLLTDSQIKCALALVPPIAVALYLSRRWDWFTSEHRHDPHFQSYVRAMARQMAGAGKGIELKEVRCA
jgi:hypothetical protein